MCQRAMCKAQYKGKAKGLKRTTTQNAKENAKKYKGKAAVLSKIESKIQRGSYGFYQHAKQITRGKLRGFEGVQSQIQRRS